MSQRTVDELDRLWGETWRAASIGAAPTAGTLRRRDRRHLWSALAQWAVGLLFLLLATLWVAGDRGPTAVVAGVMVWLFVAVALGFDLWNRRGTWRASDSSSRAWLELGCRRLAAKRRAMRFGWGLLAAEVAFFVPWLAWSYQEVGASLWRYLAGYGFLIAMIVGFAIGIWWIDRGTGRELAAVREQLAAYDAT